MRAVGVEVALEHRVHRRGREAEIGEAAGVRRDHVVAAEQRHLVAGEDGVGEEAAGDALQPVEDAGLAVAIPKGTATIRRRRRMIASMRCISSRKLSTSGPPSS